MSGFITNIVPRKFLDTYDNIMNYINNAFYPPIAPPAGTNNKIIETSQVVPSIQDLVEYSRENKYRRIIRSASNWLEIFRNREIISFFGPYQHMVCYNKYSVDMITAVNHQLEKRADKVANRKHSTIFNWLSNDGTNNDTNPEPINKELDEVLIQDESIKGINSNDCIFKLSRLAMKKMELYIGRGITVKSQPRVKSQTSSTKKKKTTIETKEKEYTIDLRKIDDEKDKNFFENFISIPPDVEKYVCDNDKPGNRKDLPICYLGTNSNHSYLFIQMPDGRVFVIGRGFLTYKTDYQGNKLPENDDSRDDTPLPGQVFGIDDYYTEASPDLNISDNWLSYVCFLDTKILENLKQMLKSTTLIKFTTVDDYLTGSVNLSFFESTAQGHNDYSYSYKNNCLGWVQQMLDIKIPVTEGNPIEIEEASAIKRTTHENVPYLLNSLSPGAINAIEKAHRTGCSNTLYNVIRDIQETETSSYGVQPLFNEDEPHPLIKHFTKQNIRELFSNPRQNLITGDIIKQLSKIFIIDDKNNILFNTKVQDYEFTKEELNQIFTSNKLNEIFLFRPKVLQQIFSRENKCMPEQVKEIFGDRYEEIFGDRYEEIIPPEKPDLKKQRKGGNKAKSRKSKVKSRKNKPKKKTLRRRKN